ncbi:MAG: hypothetical protein K8R58_12195 [Bacteroidales bacterium]|nr:hypothetical protein [Bacteroidales bacterium]
MKELIKGKIYSKDEIKNFGLTLYKELSSKIVIYKKDKQVYYFCELKGFSDGDNFGKLKLLMIDN